LTENTKGGSASGKKEQRSDSRDNMRLRTILNRKKNMKKCPKSSEKKTGTGGSTIGWKVVRMRKLFEAKGGLGSAGRNGTADDESLTHKSAGLRWQPSFPR